MTPKLLNEAAEKIAPHKKQLLFVEVASGLATLSLFLVGYAFQQSGVLFSLGLWASTTVFFWSSWFLFILYQYKNLPTKTHSVLGGFNFYLNRAFSQVGAVFMTLWLVGLAYVTFAALFNIMFSYGS